MTTQTIKRTALYNAHVQAGGHMVPFSGWEMPLHYGSQIEEHHAVRKSWGVFDVSHMCVLDITGQGTKDFLRILLANDVNKLHPHGDALYSCMLNHSGGVVDDLIVYALAEEHYRLVVNAGTAEKDRAWITQHLPDNVTMQKQDICILAIQGPQAIAGFEKLFDRPGLSMLPRFTLICDDEISYARTGYTGEDGLELMMPAHLACDIWQTLMQAGVQPCGLGARDTLRLEAAYNLYGTDMDENTMPWEARLAWTIDMKDADRSFVGKSALLAAKKAGITQTMVGLVMHQPGVLRALSTLKKGSKTFSCKSSAIPGP